VNIPDFVAVGHLCCDLVDGRRILGDSASYAALTAHRLGRSVGIVTAVAEDFPFMETFTGISIENVRSHSTTTFRNVCRNGVREQFISNAKSSKENSGFRSYGCVQREGAGRTLTRKGGYSMFFDSLRR
jgi:hypothetical protein